MVETPWLTRRLLFRHLFLVRIGEEICLLTRTCFLFNIETNRVWKQRNSISFLCSVGGP